ncbi:MAG TPA: hypothetical protein VEC57_08140 [Candidatus Limnocylindrales bacterium]|nr:hypothetical protein [Candidatus Limnocylindrales bacterium]
MAPGPDQPLRRSPLSRAWVGACLLALYALTLFAPPPAQPQLPLPADAALLERLFPGVPWWWVLGRVACLLAGAALVATAARVPAPVRLVRRPTPPSPRPLLAWLAAALALAHAVLSLFVSFLTWRPAQIAYLLALPLPALLLWMATPRAATTRARAAMRRALPATALVLAAWCLWRTLAHLHSPRAATPIDLWLNFQWLLAALGDGRNLLVSTSQAGVPDTYMVFAGGPLMEQVGLPPSLTLIQAVHALWILASAALVASLGAASSGAAAAPVAAAVFLFSPLMLLSHLAPAPFGMLTFLSAALLVLLRRILAYGSPAAVAGFGMVAGVAVIYPHLTHLAAATSLVGMVSVLRRRPLPMAAIVTGTASFFAAVIPALPSLETLQAMNAEYLVRNWQWAGAEAVLLGQRSAHRVPDIAALIAGGRAGPFDIAIGGLLMPFAVPRTAMRLCGDALFDPLGTTLAAVGLAACALRWRRRGPMLALLAFALAFLPAAASSSTDRISLTRAIATPVMLAVLAGAGFQVLRTALAAPRALAAAVVVLVAGGGALLFDEVTPRLVAASAIELHVESLQENADASRALLLAQEADWYHEVEIAAYLPAKPLRVLVYDPETLAREQIGSRGELLMWSPALEEEVRIGRNLCPSFPQAALYVLEDRAGLGRAFAADLSGPAWTPSLPPSRWKRLTCAQAHELHSRY